jgi:hypothetical protein
VGHKIPPRAYFASSANVLACWEELWATRPLGGVLEALTKTATTHANASVSLDH